MIENVKKISAFLLLLSTLVFTACIKDLREEGIYESTRCYGVVVNRLTGQPVANVAISTVDPSGTDQTVYTNADGTFEIAVQLSKLVADYFVSFTSDSLYQTYEFQLNDLPLGGESYNLGTIYFEGQTFPSVSISEPEDVTTTSARLAAYVEDMGYAEIEEHGFVFSTMQYPTIHNEVMRVHNGSSVFDTALSLQPNTTYYIRAYAKNKIGIGYSQQMMLSTLSGLPLVSTSDVSDITPTTAMCGGLVSIDGGFGVISRGLCWGIAPNPTVDNLHEVVGADTGSFACKLSDMRPGTTYYVRAYAQNAVGTAYGNQRVFTTASGLPEVATTVATHVSSTSAQAGGSVLSDGGYAVLRRGVCYSTSPYPTLADPHTTDGIGLGDFISQMTPLTPGTTYYFRSYATNGIGTVYGSQYTFTTE